MATLHGRKRAFKIGHGRVETRVLNASRRELKGVRKHGLSKKVCLCFRKF